MPSFAFDMIAYIESPEESIDKLLELINELRKVTGYKVNMQNHCVFINQQTIEKESFKYSTIIIA